MQNPRNSPWLWLLRFIGLIVPQRLRADWRQEWEAELQWRETQLAEWDQLNFKNKLDLLWHSAGAFVDALWLQPKRWEDEMVQDIRFGARMLRKHRWLTLVAVLSLGLGIGTTSVMYALIDQLLLHDVTAHEPERLVQFKEHVPWHSYPRLMLRESLALVIAGAVLGVSVQAPS